MTEDMMDAAVEKLRLRIKEDGRTQEQLAKDSGVSRRTIVRILAEGTFRPSTWKKLYNALDGNAHPPKENA